MLTCGTRPYERGTQWDTNSILKSFTKLSKFLRRSLLIFIIKDFQTIVFIVIISTTFRPIRPPAFFRCLSNSGTFTELWTTTFIETTGVTCSDSVSHNRVQVLSIPVLLLASSEDWTSNLQMIVSLKLREPTPITVTPCVQQNRTGDPRGFNKGRSSKFREVSRVRLTPEEGRKTYRPKRCGNNNKDEDNSQKILNDK